MRGRCPVDGNSERSIRHERDGQLILGAGQRHRHTVLARQERFGRKLIDDPFKTSLVGDRPIAGNLSFPQPPNGQGSCRVPADPLQDSDGILR
jgi:hypothetical protein